MLWSITIIGWWISSLPVLFTILVPLSLSLLEGTSIDLCSPLNWIDSIKGIGLDRGRGRGHKSGLRDNLLAFSMCTHTIHTHVRICLLRYVHCTFLCACGSACCAPVRLFTAACQHTMSHHSAELLSFPSVCVIHVCLHRFIFLLPKKHRWWRVVVAGRVRGGHDESLLCVCCVGPNT